MPATIKPTAFEVCDQHASSRSQLSHLFFREDGERVKVQLRSSRGCHVCLIPISRVICPRVKPDTYEGPSRVPCLDSGLDSGDPPVPPVITVGSIPCPCVTSIKTREPGAQGVAVPCQMAVDRG